MIIHRNKHKVKEEIMKSKPVVDPSVVTSSYSSSIQMVETERSEVS